MKPNTYKILLLIFLSTNASAATLSLNPRLHMNQVEEGPNFSRLSGASVSVDWMQEHRFTEFHLDARLQAENGQSDYRQTEEYNPSSGISLREGLASLNAKDIAYVRVGTLDQSRMKNRAIVSSQGFPGIMEELVLENDLFYSELRAEQVVPNSVTTRKTSYRADNGKSQLLYEKLHLGVHEKSKFKLGLFAGHYAFSGLSSASASASSPLGNQIRGTSEETATFTEKFVGVEYGVEGNVELSGFSIEGDYRILSAESSSLTNQDESGYLGSVGFSTAAIQQMVYQARLSRFHLPGHLGPSVFGSKNFGYNNRQGVSGTLTIAEPTKGMNYGMTASLAEEIIDSPLQDRFALFTLHLGYSYVHVFGR